jgi:hypothetical protein
MPTTTNYINLLYVNLGFISIISVMYYFKQIHDIKENWPIYRCNPSYWIFSDNISDDFTYCVQNTQMNMMDYLLQPVNYMLSSLTSIGGGLNDSINNLRFMFNNIRNFVSDIIQNVFGVFFNLIIEFQKMIISIKDMIGKMIGIVVTIMYVLDGSIKTMNSTWAGPPGQLVRSIGSCFHPQTRIMLANGHLYAMENIPLGSILPDGGKVFAVLKIHNAKKEPLYKIKDTSILVTGEHFILDKFTNKWIQVKNAQNASIENNNEIIDYFSCLITTTRHIPIQGQLFWDWEDDELTKT